MLWLFNSAQLFFFTLNIQWHFWGLSLLLNWLMFKINIPSIMLLQLGLPSFIQVTWRIFFFFLTVHIVINSILLLKHWIKMFSLFYWFKKIFISLFSWRSLIFIMARGIFSCSMQTLSCDMWNLVPQPRIRLGPPALGVQSLSHWTTSEVPRFSL